MRTILASLIVSVLGVHAWAATPMVRFNVVPRQEFDQPVEMGVLAFHKDGIREVQFDVAAGATTRSYSASEATLNDRTATLEYLFTLDPGDFPDGLAEVTATAVADDGTASSRAVTVEAYLNGSGSLSPPTRVYVSPSAGSDSNPGTSDLPFETINRAWYSLENEAAGVVVLQEPGEYILTDFLKNDSPLEVSRWFTIEAAPGLSRDDVVIRRESDGFIRTYTNMVRWSGVTFDFATIRNFYDDQIHLDNCVVFSSKGWTVEATGYPFQNTAYVTDSLVYDIVYGFTGTELLRNSYMHKISGDAMANSSFVANVTVDLVDGRVLEHHTDLYQSFGPKENIIVYNVLATHLFDTQSIFLEPTYLSALGEERHTMRDAAFVDLWFFNEPNLYNEDPNWGGPPYSQLISKFDHVLFDNVHLPGQRMYLRTEWVSGETNQYWEASDVIFRDSEFHYTADDRWVDPAYSTAGAIVEGVTFVGNTRSLHNYAGTPADLPDAGAGYSAPQFGGSSVPPPSGLRVIGN